MISSEPFDVFLSYLLCRTIPYRPLLPSENTLVFLAAILTWFSFHPSSCCSSVPKSDSTVTPFWNNSVPQGSTLAFFLFSLPLPVLPPTHTHTTTNYSVEFPTFGEITGVAHPGKPYPGKTTFVILLAKVTCFLVGVGGWWEGRGCLSIWSYSHIHLSSTDLF